MVKLTVSVSLVFLQLSVLSRTSVGAPVPVWNIITGPPVPSAPPLEGKAFDILLGVTCVPIAVCAACAGVNAVRHCVNGHRTKQADTESGPDPGPTTGAHNPGKDHHDETPDAKTPLLRRPSVDAVHSSKSG